MQIKAKLEEEINLSSAITIEDNWHYMNQNSKSNCIIWRITQRKLVADVILRKQIIKWHSVDA